MPGRGGSKHATVSRACDALVSITKSLGRISGAVFTKLTAESAEALEDIASSLEAEADNIEASQADLPAHKTPS